MSIELSVERSEQGEGKKHKPWALLCLWGVQITSNRLICIYIMGENGPDIIRTGCEICKGGWSPAGDGGIMTYQSLIKPPLSHIPRQIQMFSWHPSAQEELKPRDKVSVWEPWMVGKPCQNHWKTGYIFDERIWKNGRAWPDDCCVDSYL